MQKEFSVAARSRDRRGGHGHSFQSYLSRGQSYVVDYAFVNLGARDKAAAPHVSTPSFELRFYQCQEVALGCK